MLILQTLQWDRRRIRNCRGFTFAIRRRASGGDRITVSGSPSIGAQSWVQSEWKQSESKQKPDITEFTAKGKAVGSDLGRWERIVEAIGSVMYVKPEESES